MCRLVYFFIVKKGKSVYAFCIFCLFVCCKSMVGCVKIYLHFPIVIYTVVTLRVSSTFTKQNSCSLQQCLPIWKRYIENVIGRRKQMFWRVLTNCPYSIVLYTMTPPQCLLGSNFRTKTMPSLKVFHYQRWCNYISVPILELLLAEHCLFLSYRMVLFLYLHYAHFHLNSFVWYVR